MIIIEETYLVFSLLFTMAYQLVFFSIANYFKFDKVTDLAGGSNFVWIALIAFFNQQTYYTRQIIATVFDVIWGVRLAAFLLKRVLERKKDERFDQIRESFWVFLGFWIFQILWVWIVSLPVILINATPIDKDINALDIIGWIFWVIGFLFEAVADQSKSSFNKKYVGNKTVVLDYGVWKYTRHPNYFGEILLWIGLFLSSLNTTSYKSWYAISVLSPVFTFILLMFLSGMPLAEQRANQKYKGNEMYQQYREKTSPLIPLPNSLYAQTPQFIKKWLLFEYDLYAK